MTPIGGVRDIEQLLIENTNGKRLNFGCGLYSPQIVSVKS
jgi:hypothetical protein